MLPAQVMNSFKVQKRCAADHIRCLSSALTVGHGHGLEPYMPNIRLVPGGPLVLDPLDIRQRPFIKEIVYEDLSGIAGAIDMFTTACAWGFHDIDNCHRLSNELHRAIKRAFLFFGQPMPRRSKSRELTKVHGWAATISGRRPRPWWRCCSAFAATPSRWETMLRA